MKKQFFYLLALVVLIGLSCQKEMSFELGDTPAEGSLQADGTGDCLPKTVNGLYAENLALVPTTNNITVTVDVTRTGVYAIGTDTVNGYFFRGVGTFTTLGPNVVTLRGNGIPFAEGTNNFVVSFDGTVCDIQVLVLPEGSGPAAFTLAGAPTTCTTPVVNGTYAKTVPLTAANTVVLNVNVIAAGSYDVTAGPVNGITFHGTGTLATGPQTITLTATGTPTTAGPNVFPVTVGASTCSFTVTVLDLITGTLAGSPGACTPITVNGTYFNGFALDASNNITIQITTTTGGPYNISTSSVAGFSFSRVGTVPGAGTHTITLNGTGTPTSVGVKNFTVTFGTSTCTFDVTVVAGAEFTADCSSAVVNGTYQAGVALDASNTVDIDVNVTVLGPYNITTASTNGMTFSDVGTFTTLGAQTITLAGAGTPTTGGTFNIPMPGLTPCTFPVTVTAAPTIDWTFTASGPSTVFSGSFDGGILDTPLPGFTLYGYGGSNATDDIDFQLTDATGGAINAGDTYSTVPGPGNWATFTYTINSGADFLTTDATHNITFTVTSHNTVTKVISGTFTGSVVNGAGAPRTITAGTFTGSY